MTHPFSGQMTATRFDPDWRFKLSAEALRTVESMERNLVLQIDDPATVGLIIPKFAGNEGAHFWIFDPSDFEDDVDDTPVKRYVRAHIYEHLHSVRDMEPITYSGWIRVTYMGITVLYTLFEPQEGISAKEYERMIVGTQTADFTSLRESTVEAGNIFEKTFDANDTNGLLDDLQTRERFYAAITGRPMENGNRAFLFDFDDPNDSDDDDRLKAQVRRETLEQMSVAGETPAGRKLVEVQVFDSFDEMIRSLGNTEGQQTNGRDESDEPPADFLPGSPEDLRRQFWAYAQAMRDPRKSGRDLDDVLRDEGFAGFREMLMDRMRDESHQGEPDDGIPPMLRARMLELIGKHEHKIEIPLHETLGEDLLISFLRARALDIVGPRGGRFQSFTAEIRPRGPTGVVINIIGNTSRRTGEPPDEMKGLLDELEEALERLDNKLDMLDPSQGSQRHKNRRMPNEPPLKPGYTRFYREDGYPDFLIELMQKADEDANDNIAIDVLFGPNGAVEISGWQSPAERLSGKGTKSDKNSGSRGSHKATPQHAGITEDELTRAFTRAFEAKLNEHSVRGALLPLQTIGIVITLLLSTVGFLLKAVNWVAKEIVHPIRIGVWESIRAIWLLVTFVNLPIWLALHVIFQTDNWLLLAIASTMTGWGYGTIGQYLFGLESGMRWPQPPPFASGTIITGIRHRQQLHIWWPNFRADNQEAWETVKDGDFREMVIRDNDHEMGFVYARQVIWTARAIDTILRWSRRIWYPVSRESRRLRNAFGNSTYRGILLTEPANHPKRYVLLAKLGDFIIDEVEIFADFMFEDSEKTREYTLTHPQLFARRYVFAAHLGVLLDSLKSWKAFSAWIKATFIKK